MRSSVITLTFIFTFWLSPTVYAQLTGFIKGADGSLLNEVEDAGGKFYDGGVEKDALQIFKDHGFNYVRLKLWHTPENEYNSLTNVMAMAKRAKNLGFGILLDIHYSDTWADPGHQEKPQIWKGLSFNVLSDSIYEYTKNVVAQLKAQNTLPDMIQIGNEITCGMLWDDGKICNPYDTPQQWSQLGTLIKKAIMGVNENLQPEEDVKIIIHFADGANTVACRWFFDNISEQEIDFDIIGVSYYSFWHGTLTDLKNNLNDLSNRYEKDIIVLEGAYPWTLDWNDNVNNIVGLPEHLLPGYPATVEGQSKFLKDLMDIIRETDGNRGKGFMYWSPEWITAPEKGSAWENMALFDFDSEVLESIKVFEDQSSIDESIRVKPFSMSSPHPNPFNGETKIDFSIKSKAIVNLSVFDSYGRMLEILIEDELSKGSYSIVWKANGRAAGVYTIIFQSDGFQQTKKVIIQ